MPSAQKPAGAEDAERALSREQPVAADAAAPTPANQGSASAEGVEFIEEDLQQDPPGNGDLLGGGGLFCGPACWAHATWASSTVLDRYLGRWAAWGTVPHRFSGSTYLS